MSQLLEAFACEDSFDAMRARARHLGRSLAASIHLAGRQPELMGLLTMLVHVSPLRIVLPNGRRLKYAPLQGLAVGESGSYKTTAICDLSERLGLAEIATSDTTTRAGLLYRIRSGTVLPGLLPRNHAKMVAIDEFHKVRPDEVRASTSPRSCGVLRVEGCGAASFPMQTRLLCVGSLRQKGARGLYGSESIALRDLEAGILGTGFLEPEDLRRFDFVLVVGRQGAKPAMPSAEPPSIEQLARLVRLYWRIDEQADEGCVWARGAYEMAREVTEALNEKYETPLLPVFGPDTLDKLCRVSAAAARLMPVEPDGKTRITPSHVRWAGFLLYSIYEMPTNGLARIARRDRAATEGPSAEKLSGLFENLLVEVPEIWTIMDVFKVKEQGSVTTATLAVETGMAIRTMTSRVRTLKDGGLVSTHGRAGLKATSLMRQLIRWRDACENTDAEGGRNCKKSQDTVAA